MFRVKRKSDFAAKRVAYLYDAMKQNKYYDTSFDVRDKMFYAHLIVLFACSEFFGTNETEIEKIMSQFSFEIIEAILKFCYTGQISIEDKHRKKLLDLAKRLKVKIPPQFKTVNSSNCLQVLKHTGDSELIKKAMDLTLDNFETLHKTQDFLNLPASIVIEILKSDDLLVSTEEDVFNSVKLWVNHDDANRKNELTQLMGSVRLSLFSMKFLVDEVMLFCLSYVECLTSIRQVLKDKIDKSSIQRDTPRGKKEKKEKIVLVGGEDLNMANTIDIYDGAKKSWTPSKHIGINKSEFASVLVGDWLVIIGGKNSSWETVTSVEYIDLKSGQKHPLKPLNQARWRFSAVTLRRGSSTDVYVGGDDSNQSMERWNSKTGDWEIIAPLLSTVYDHSASVMDGKIFVTGGLTNDYKSTDKVQVYSVETNFWTYRPQMIQARHSHSSVAFKGKLYVAGGRVWQTSTKLDNVEYYDPIANVWTAFTKLPEPAYGINLCCFQNKLLSMGGYDRVTRLSDVWEYDETTTSWKASSSLSRKRAYFTALVIPYDSII
ncbi:kelch-like protein 25 isoform X1 [Arctopsyche grandis]|uniref:kelch-like protein 25 isoform X1 n=1 Tax=Arctopsyche grandis TaxID=121162 RepID=UPI00406D7E79